LQFPGEACRSWLVQVRSAAPHHLLGEMRGKFFVYGTHFYRPPDPPTSERRRMLQEIAQTYKFNTIRIWTPWAYCNPAPDRFEFSEIKELMDYCDEFGLKVLMGVMIEDAPYWLQEAHSETRYVNANEHAYRLGGGGTDVAASRQGLCLDWQPVRTAASKYLREMAKVVSPHSSLFAYDCWNEPQVEPSKSQLFNTRPDVKELYCYCRRTVAVFQSWLRKRYGNLDSLNEAWVRRYPTWSVVNPPREQGAYADWTDWFRFLIDRSTEEMRFPVEQIRAVDPHSLLESHIGTVQVAVDSTMAVPGVNPWRFAEQLETWGITYFPRGGFMGRSAGELHDWSSLGPKQARSSCG
jgi:beta-galactosidase GanA